MILLADEAPPSIASVFLSTRFLSCVRASSLDWPGLGAGVIPFAPGL